MKYILSFLVTPTKEAKQFSEKTSNEKYVIGGILLLTSAFVGGYVNYLTPFLFNKLPGLSYSQLFLYDIIVSIVFIGLIWGLGKILGGKAKFEDIFGITMLSYILYIFANIFKCITFLMQSLFIFYLSFGVYIIAFIWFLFIWSRGLFVIEKISETKITLMVVISLIIVYYLEATFRSILNSYNTPFYGL